MIIYCQDTMPESCDKIHYNKIIFENIRSGINKIIVSIENDKPVNVEDIVKMYEDILFIEEVFNDKMIGVISRCGQRCENFDPDCKKDCNVLREQIYDDIYYIRKTLHSIYNIIDLQNE